MSGRELARVDPSSFAQRLMALEEEIAPVQVFRRQLQSTIPRIESWMNSIETGLRASLGPQVEFPRWIANLETSIRQVERDIAKEREARASEFADKEAEDDTWWQEQQELLDARFADHVAESNAYTDAEVVRISKEMAEELRRRIAVSENSQRLELTRLQTAIDVMQRMGMTPAGASQAPPQAVEMPSEAKGRFSAIDAVNEAIQARLTALEELERTVQTRLKAVEAAAIAGQTRLAAFEEAWRRLEGLELVLGDLRAKEGELRGRLCAVERLAGNAEDVDILRNETRTRFTHIEEKIEQIGTTRDAEDFARKIADLSSRTDTGVRRNEEVIHMVKAQASCIELNLQSQATKLSNLEADLAQVRVSAGAVHSVPPPSAPSMPFGPLGATIIPPGIIPPSDTVSRVSSVLKWSRRLDKMTFSEVRTFTKQFRQFVTATNLGPETAKILLYQHAYGPALKFLETLPDSLTWTEIIERLVARVRPSNSTVLRALLQCKQGGRESIQEFMVRYSTLAESYPSALINTSELRGMLVENLNERWRPAARTMVQADSSISIDELLHKLVDIEGPSVDAMDIDHIDRMVIHALEETQQPVEAGGVNFVVSNGRINWGEVRDPRTLMMAWRQLMRSDRTSREECLRWLHNKPSANQGRRPPSRQQRPPVGNNRRRIFNVDEEMDTWEDNVFDQAEGSHGAYQIDEQHGQLMDAYIGNTGAASPSDGRVLMFVQAKLNGVGMQSLVDTGAAVSILPLDKAKKLGVSVDQRDRRILAGFNGTHTESVGMTNLEVDVGGRRFVHPFCVLNKEETKIIFGNDLMKAQNWRPEPAHHQVRLPDNSVVPCHVLTPSGLNTQGSSNAQLPKTVTCTEQVVVDPVLKDDLLLIPAGRSMVIPAKSSKTVVLPFKFSETVSVMDSNRLPPGIVTNATVWAKDQKLRLTMTNTSPKSVMIGSKAAVGCVVIKRGTVQKIDQSGQVIPVRRV